jgi:hypothetical protein
MLLSTYNNTTHVIQRISVYSCAKNATVGAKSFRVPNQIQVSKSFTSSTVPPTLHFTTYWLTMKTETMISALVALMLASAAYAAKDDSYYSDGVTNPNVEERMYWHAPYNVLQDLSQFKKLYVKHHACV